MSRPSPLRVQAGPLAAAHLRTHGLRPEDVALIPAAAGGPKGLVLNPLDRFLFGDWLGRSRRPGQVLHLAGASIGAWRMACACAPDADAALAAMAEAYITQDYPHAPGRAPEPAVVSRVFGATIAAQFGPPGGAREAALLAHPQRRLHLVTARGRGLLAGRPGRLRTALGFGAAWAGNALARPGLGLGLTRCVFSDPRDALPLPLAEDGLPTRRIALDGRNLQAALRASCAIPFWLQPEQDVPGAPPGPHWDGGLADYHFHWPYAALPEGPQAPSLVLYPHFQPTLVPGWFDKPWRRRHRPTPALDRLVLLSLEPAWVAGLPGGKLPDRSDFQRWADDVPARIRAWRCALAASQALAEAFADWVEGRRALAVQPL